MRRSVFVGIVSGLIMILTAGPALADQCTNVSKSDPTAGAQIVLGSEGEILFVTQGLQHRLEQGLIGPNGEGFHGIIAFDFDGDGNADISTWVGVGPDGHEIPLEAQYAGPACRGLTNIGVYLTECVGV